MNKALFTVMIVIGGWLIWAYLAAVVPWDTAGFEGIIFASLSWYGTLKAILSIGKKIGAIDD